MKVKIKSFNGELPDYLTKGKVYSVTRFYDGDEKYPCIIADNNHYIVLFVDECAHLNSGSWEVVK